MTTYFPTERTSNMMKPEHVEVLVECFHRMRELAETPRPPAWQVWALDEYDEQQEHGPRYACGDWFDTTLDHERMRFRRAINDLERGGLLTTWRRWGRRLSNIRLTPQGEVIAQSLVEEMTPSNENPAGRPADDLEPDRQSQVESSERG